MILRVWKEISRRSWFARVCLNRSEYIGTVRYAYEVDRNNIVCAATAVDHHTALSSRSAAEKWENNNKP